MCMKVWKAKSVSSMLWTKIGCMTINVGLCLGSNGGYCYKCSILFGVIFSMTDLA